MDWIRVDDAIFDFASSATEVADLAIYGRVTYGMMEAYWPTAGDRPRASKHDKEHSAWYNKVDKIVLSRSMAGQDIPRVTVVGDKLGSRIGAVKKQTGGQIVIFGSPGAVHSLMKEGLVDEFWLFVNPVLLGKGTPMFKDIEGRQALELVFEKRFDSGVVALQYKTI
jgi:dihydrofolate reductase